MDQQILSQLKLVCDHLERLRNLEQLLERIAISNERMAKMMEESWKAYNQIKR